MISVINLLKEYKADYEMRMNSILESITPKENFLLFWQPKRYSKITKSGKGI